jgi:hypothetical protein
MSWDTTRIPKHGHWSLEEADLWSDRFRNHQSILPGDRSSIREDCRRTWIRDSSDLDDPRPQADGEFRPADD